MKRKVYLVQANHVYGKSVKNTYIPYAAGCIAAYSWADMHIDNNYSLGRFIYTREQIDKAVESLEKPFIVAFSCSVWNMEYNKFFAKKLKTIFPKCIVIFGGHHVSLDAQNLKDFQYVDFLIHGGGEEAFRDILLHFIDNRPLEEIPNISYRNLAGATFTTIKRVPETQDYPSPYLEGYFDSIMKDNIEFSAIIETNRGCPFSCSFCDWGALKSKVRLFSLDKVFKELDWLAKNKIEYVFCGDSNFGLFDRDEIIADYIVNLKLTKGYPSKFRVAFTKNRIEFVQRINQKFSDNCIGKSQSLSFQSLCPNVLKNIGRTNMDLEYFKNLMRAYNQSDISVFSELIIGLPGETYESFSKGICTLLEYGQHKSISVYPCELLPNSEMGTSEYKKKYRIKTVKTPFNQIHTDITEFENDIQEYSEFLVETYSMTKQDWVNCVVFSAYIQSFHNLGILREIAIYLRHEKNISYFEFYSSLLNYFKNKKNSFCHNLYEDIYNLACGVVNGKNAWVCSREKFGDITWGFDEILFLEAASNLDEFFEGTKEFLLSFDPSDPILLDVCVYQKSIVKQISKKRIDISLKYDFYSYFSNLYSGNYTKLKKIDNTLIIEDKLYVDNWEDYAREIVWYGRRDDDTLYTGSKYKLKQMYS